MKNTHPFAILAMVALPKHLHATWRLPPGDADYPRWLLIKAGFSRWLAKDERIRVSRQASVSEVLGFISFSPTYRADGAFAAGTSP